MMKLTKERAIERLQKALDEIPTLKTKHCKSEDFMVWRRNTLTAIQRSFDDVEHAQEFEKLQFVQYWADPPTIYIDSLGEASAMLTSMIEEITEYCPEVAEVRNALTQPSGNELVPVNAGQVFVVHGRNQRARDAMFAFLRSIDLHPLEWNEAVCATGRPMPYIGEILDTAFSQAGAVVVLMTPDDKARLREAFRSPNEPPHETELTGQARPNVLFEAGMAMGRNPARTILVELGILRPFTDVAGLHVIRMDGSSQRRQELAQRLESTGCPVNLDGTDWHTAGDFDAALSET